jgi:hypothetical protein
MNESPLLTFDHTFPCSHGPVALYFVNSKLCYINLSLWLISIIIKAVPHVFNDFIFYNRSWTFFLRVFDVLRLKNSNLMTIWIRCFPNIIHKDPLYHFRCL